MATHPGALRARGRKSAVLRAATAFLALTLPITVTLSTRAFAGQATDASAISGYAAAVAARPADALVLEDQASTSICHATAAGR
jgi:hypothetical protein